MDAPGSAGSVGDRGLARIGDALPTLTDRVRRARPRCGNTVVVAVDGPSGSGKTTVAAGLSMLLPKAAVVRMDELYPGWDGLAPAVGALCEQVLAPIARGELARYRRYDWVVGAFGPAVVVPPAPVLVVEGVGSSAGPGAGLLAVRVWVEADEAVRRARALARDGEAYRPHWWRWAKQERALFMADRTRSRADVVIDTSPDP